MDWYDMIARRNGGYKSSAQSTVEGISCENVFESKLISFLKPTDIVLDAGCGSGEFTLKMAQYARHITGFDFSQGMLDVAEKNKMQAKINHVAFIFAHTHKPMPFFNEQFEITEYSDAFECFENEAEYEKWLDLKHP